MFSAKRLCQNFFCALGSNKSKIILVFGIEPKPGYWKYLILPLNYTSKLTV